MMPRVGRTHIIHDEGKPLVDIDIKNCHPRLLITLCGEDRASYESFLSGPDIYTRMANECGIHKPRTAEDAEKLNLDPEDTLKTDWMKGINGLEKNYVYYYYLSHFPVLMNNLIGLGKDNIAARLQALETKVMMMVYGKCMEQGLFISNPAHDGCISIKDHESEVAEIVITEFFKETGHAPVVSSKELRVMGNVTTYDKHSFPHNTILNPIEPLSLSLSYVVLKNHDSQSLNSFKCYIALGQLAACAESDGIDQDDQLDSIPDLPKSKFNPWKHKEAQKRAAKRRHYMEIVQSYVLNPQAKTTTHTVEVREDTI